MHTTLLSSVTLWAAAAAKTTATTAAKTTTKASSSDLIFYVIPVLLIAYLVILRPQRKRQQAQRQQQTAIVEGDTIATIGGIVGRVVSIDSDRAIVEVAPDLEMEFLRQAIARKVEPLVPVDLQDQPEEGDEDEGDGDDDRGWHGYHPEDVDHVEDVAGPGAADGAHPDADDGAGQAAQDDGQHEHPPHDGAADPDQAGPEVTVHDSPPAPHPDPADLGSAFGVPAVPVEPAERSAE